MCGIYRNAPELSLSLEQAVWYNIPISTFTWRGVLAMSDREAQIEALWTYEISTEKVLRRAVKKGFITQAEADEFSEKLFEQLDTRKIPGFLPLTAGREDAGRAGQHEHLCLHDGDRKGEEVLQPWLSYTELDEEQHHNRISTDVGENLQPQISRGRL